MSGKLVLIDGHSILNRAFYGVPDLSNAQGLHTNAVYGFLNILFKILEEEQAEYLTVAFDVKAPTFRHEIYAEYKGTRKPMPEELRQQVPVMKEVLKAMGVAVVEQPGLEADDILGTLAKKAEQDGLEVALVSGDRDLLQIASEHICVRIPKTKGGKTEIENYYAKDVLEKYQVTPQQFIDLKALMGDSSDNIPGVPKVGEKTATELMVRFGSLDGIYEHLEDITKKSIKQSLTENKHLADLSRVLAEINTDGSFPYDRESARIGNLYTQEAYSLFKQLEFKNLLGRFEKSGGVQEKHDNYKLITGLTEAEEIFNAASGQEWIGLFLAGEFGKYNGMTSFQGVGLSWGDNTYFIKAEGFLTKEYLLDKVKETASLVKISCMHIKNYYALLGTENLEQVRRLFDIQLAAYLINPLKNDYETEDIANEYLGKMIPSRKELFEKESLEKALENHPEEFLRYVCEQAWTAANARQLLAGKLEEMEMLSLFLEMEMPLSFVLHDMEVHGIGIRPDELKAYGEALISGIDRLEKSIYQKAGVEFNINSPKQLGEVLFETMGLPGGKKTKTGYSTAADVLDKLAADYPIVNEILEYRGLTKLKSTYADGLANYIEADARIHSSFNQTITATGRISSTEPNLQNIPMRMELGRLIRKVFVPKEGCVFTDADYSQIELRILAHMSGDKQLIEAYNMDEDIHRITASKVFHTPLEEVTDLQRRNAKAVNFGIVYGISSFGLSQDLSITRKEAAAYIEQYFATYPQVKEFLDGLVAQAKEKGYAVTLFGRRRPVPELKSSNFMQRSFGERVAMNSPIQGTAADVIKIAMIKVWSELKKEKLKSRLILQVHDELLIETYEDETVKVEEILRRQMKNAADLAVTLEVDLHTGNNWYEAK